MHMGAAVARLRPRALASQKAFSAWLDGRVTLGELGIRNSKFKFWQMAARELYRHRTARIAQG
jgi:hypothetical protein